MTEFHLTIRLGNAEMQTPEDCAQAVARVAALLGAGARSGTVRDLNGNTTGDWGCRRYGRACPWPDPDSEEEPS